MAERNVVAKAFWPRAIAAAPTVSRLVRLEGDGKPWIGPIWSFKAGDRTQLSRPAQRLHFRLWAKLELCWSTQCPLNRKQL